MDAESTGEIQKMRQETREVLRRGAYFWIVMVMTSLVSAAGAILVSVINTNRSERKLCSVVITTDDAHHRSPPQTPIGKIQAENFARLRRELGCAPYKENGS